MAAHCLKVGIDFGTTFSGVAYVSCQATRNFLNSLMISLDWYCETRRCYLNNELARCKWTSHLIIIVITTSMIRKWSCAELTVPVSHNRSRGILRKYLVRFHITLLEKYTSGAMRSTKRMKNWLGSSFFWTQPSMPAKTPQLFPERLTCFQKAHNRKNQSMWFRITFRA